MSNVYSRQFNVGESGHKIQETPYPMQSCDDSEVDHACSILSVGTSCSRSPGCLEHAGDVSDGPAGVEVLPPSAEDAISCKSLLLSVVPDGRFWDKWSSSG